MSACAQILTLVASRRLGALEASESALVESHLAGCATCPETARELEAALDLACAGARPDVVKAQESASGPEAAAGKGWARLEDELAQQERVALLPVRLACTYCHDALERGARVHCAACLAPYHVDCFREHGRCSIAGCSETRVVQPTSLTPVVAPLRRRAWAPLAGVLVLGGVAAAALRPGREPAPAPVPTVALDPGATYVGSLGLTYPNFVSSSPEPGPGDVTSVGSYSFAGGYVIDNGRPSPAPSSAASPAASPAPSLPPETAEKVTAYFRDTHVQTVMALFAAYSRKKILVSPGVRGDLSLNIHDVNWFKALHAIVKTAGDFEIVEEAADTLHVVPSRPAPETSDLPRAVGNVASGTIVAVHEGWLRLKDRDFLVPLDDPDRDGLLLALEDARAGERIALEYRMDGGRAIICSLVVGKHRTSHALAPPGRDRDELFASVPERLELGNDAFEWQLRSAPEGKSWRDFFSLSRQRLAVTNTGETPILFGKHKRSWREFSLYFRLRFERGTKASLLGRIATTGWQGLSSANDFAAWEHSTTWDEIPLCNSEPPASEPGAFVGVPEKNRDWTSATLEFRIVGDRWDAIVDGKAPHTVSLLKSAGNRSGGFGFLVRQGKIEVEDLYARVLTSEEPGSRPEGR